ncbi:MAG: divalent-cation tolerance protein CutA [Acidithiobacillus sp.]|uniref:divalent-cation tolerance protein CutA n=1 Tax=Acidithiobacillus sp. TaxID=1872118 RepID=UPI003D07E5D5
MTHAPDPILLVLCSIPDSDTLAREMAGALLEQKLAACVHCLPPGLSLYVWKGELEEQRERTLLIKTQPQRYPELERALLALHPYEVPEILAVRVDAALDAYAGWLGATLT